MLILIVIAKNINTLQQIYFIFLQVHFLKGNNLRANTARA